jgi:hypothetical protein
MSVIITDDDFSTDEETREIEKTLLKIREEDLHEYFTKKCMKSGKYYNEDEDYDYNYSIVISYLINLRDTNYRKFNRDDDIHEYHNPNDYDNSINLLKNSKIFDKFEVEDFIEEDKILNDIIKKEHNIINKKEKELICKTDKEMHKLNKEINEIKEFQKNKKRLIEEKYNIVIEDDI